jgi:acetyl-CoA synthetase (ADP-forming)
VDAKRNFAHGALAETLKDNRVPTDRLQPTPVAHIVNPHSVAIIGASESVSKFGGRILHNTKRLGFDKTVLPINPNRETLLGYKTYPSISAAPGPIDVAVVAVPATQLKETIIECADAGVRAAIVVTAQLAEFDEAGARLQDEVVAIARAKGMRIIGPNCMGMINAPWKLGLTSSPVLLAMERLRPGGVGFATQSGALMGALAAHAEENGIGISSMITVGNQADLELTDFFDYFVDDPQTRLICLYIEGLKSPQRFAEIARRAADAGKPVLAVKAGRSERGAAAARSHTASLAGSFEAFAALCRSCGVIAMDEAEGMIATAGVLDRTARLGKGGIGLIAGSGGNAAVTLDRIATRKLPLAQFSALTHERLQEHFLPKNAWNPSDLGAHKGVLTPERFPHITRIVFDDEDTAVVFFVMTPQPLMPETVDGIVAAWRATNKPIVFVYDTGGFFPDVAQRAVDARLPFVRRIDDGFRALEAMFALRRTAEELALSAAKRPAGAAPPASWPHGQLTESEAKTLFSRYGIAVNRSVQAKNADEAVIAAKTIGFPVVLKGESRTIIHKSDAGLVHLALKDEVAVRSAYTATAAALKTLAPSEMPIVSIQAMTTGTAEFIVGTRYDESYGPQVLFGFGGVLVEVLRDVRSLPAPASAGMIERLLRELTLAPLFDGVRGQPPLDIGALTDIIVRASWLAADAGPRLRELDINPVIVSADGAVAVDGRASFG